MSACHEILRPYPKRVPHTRGMVDILGKQMILSSHLFIKHVPILPTQRKTTTNWNTAIGVSHILTLVVANVLVFSSYSSFTHLCIFFNQNPTIPIIPIPNLHPQPSRSKTLRFRRGTPEESPTKGAEAFTEDQLTRI